MKSAAPIDAHSVDVVQSLDEISTGGSAAAYQSFVESLEGLARLWYCPAWLRAAEPAFTRSGERPFFVFVRRADEILGVAPFLCDARGVAPLHYRRLRFWGTGGSYLEYPTWRLLARSGDENHVENLVIEALEGKLRDQFDELALARVDRSNPFIERLCSVFRVAEREDRGEQVLLFGNHQHIDDKLSAKYAKRFRKAEQKLRSSFSSFQMTSVSRVDERVIDEIRGLHIRRQHELIARGVARTSCFEDPIESEVLLSMMAIAQERGALRVYLQRVDGELTNFWICFASDGSVVAEIMASRRIPGHSDASSCMTRFILKEEIEKHGTEWFDLGFGSNHQKRLFSNSAIPLRSMVLRNDRAWPSRLRYRVLTGLRLAKRLTTRN